MDKVLTIGIFDVNSLRGFSGIPQNLVRALETQPNVSLKILPYESNYQPKYSKRVIFRLMKMTTGFHYLWEKETARCRQISRELDQLLDIYRVDAVLIFGSEGCAFSKTEIPIYCYSDSIFGTRVGFYEDQKNICYISVKEGKEVQQAALNRISKMFVSSEWSWRQAIQQYHYSVNPDKFAVVGIGANLPSQIYGLSPEPMPLTKKAAHFIWVGVDWNRKGGDFAVRIVDELRAIGYNAYLHIIGPVYPSNRMPWMHCYGRLDYTNEKDFNELKSIYSMSYALLLPTQADITPVAIAEAAAFGRPAVASSIGGISEMIIHGKTGLTLPLNDPRVWANEIIHFASMNAAEDIVVACLNQYNSRLNWESIARTIVSSVSLPADDNKKRDAE